MNLALHEVTDGVFVSGWTCGHCPRPPRGAANFFKHQNAMKALHQVLKNPGQNIKFCKGNILLEEEAIQSPVQPWHYEEKGYAREKQRNV
jgi:hypothetical protein